MEWEISPVWQKRNSVYRQVKYQEVKYMMKLENFVGMMTGHFDNKDQFKKMQAEGKTYCL